MSFAELLGLERLSVGGGEARLRVTVTDAHLNLHGRAHGGLLYALADEAFALASNSHEADAVALDVHMSYLKAVRAGEVITAHASEEHLGRRVARYRVELTREGERVALFAGSVYRMPPRSPPGGT